MGFVYLAIDYAPKTPLDANDNDYRLQNQG